MFNNCLTYEWRSTTILCMRDDKEVVLVGDGQVSFGNTIIKSQANKIRSLANNSIVAGFAGSTADALTLFIRLEEKLNYFSNNLTRSVVELAKDWRLDKYLRKLEAMIIIADRSSTFIVTGNGDVLEPEHGLAAIGSGSSYALAAAKALTINSNLNLTNKAIKSIQIAADICIYTNHNIAIKKIII